MKPVTESIEIKPNLRVLICLCKNGKYEYKYLGKINPAKKIFFTFRPLNNNSRSQQIISLPYSLIKKLSDERFNIVIQTPGKKYNISASEYLLKAQLENQNSEKKGIRLSLNLCEKNFKSIKLRHAI
jgi:hypothetical protein